MEVMVTGISIFFTIIFIPYVMNMLSKADIVCKNYKGELIPTGMGITIVPVTLISFLILILFYQDTYTILLFFLVGITTMSFVGILDDLVGNRNAVGFKGHISCALKGQITTGFMKAAIGGLLALFISIIVSDGLIAILINTFIITLFTNFFNLLDIRPGRALKGYLIIAALFMMLGITGTSRLIVAIFIGYCLAYLPQDLKARSMMGDAGSNTLGITLGIATVLSFSMNIKYLIFIFLVLIHLICEKYSLSQIIKNNYILNYLDQLGR
ncbi:MAG: glycosyltransferase [Clostridiaceae bacterium]|nr:glycosyltransferase [Clostridiaceae bacterium]